MESFEAKLAAHKIQPSNMLATTGPTLQLITSVTFAAPDLRTVYIGSLGMNRLRLAGLAGTLLYFGTIFLVPALLAHIRPSTQHILAQAGIILAVLLVCLLFLVVVLRWSAYHTWGSHQQLTLITGSLLPAILLSLFLPSAWLNAQPAVTLPCLALLIWAAYRTRESNFLPR